MFCGPKCFHAVLYTALENHVPLPRFPETFSMWYRIVFGTGNDIGFITVAICGGYISKYPELRSKKTSKLRATGLCAGNSPSTGECPAQMASNAENVSIWWRYHEISLLKSLMFDYCARGAIIGFMWWGECFSGAGAGTAAVSSVGSKKN